MVASQHNDMLRTHRWPGMRQCSMPSNGRVVLLVILLVVLGIVTLSGLAALSALPATQQPAPFFVVQLTDPQFGLQDSNVQWREEQAMLNSSLHSINRLKPRLVVLTGDLQNYLPTSAGTAWPMRKPHGIHAAHPGRDQAAAVAQSLTLLSASIPIRATIPGNHDLGCVCMPWHHSNSSPLPP